MAVEVKGGALESDVYDVISSWLACKNSIPKRWNGETGPIGALPYAEIQALGMKGRSKLLSRARNTMTRLKSLSDIINELASAIQDKAEAARENMGVINNMCGLASLPNELLARILECVVNGDASPANSTRWKAAVTLSHVCQYFRNTALSCPQMWENISRSSEMADLCLSRSKEVPLDVELMVGYEPGTNPGSCELFFEQLLFGALSDAKRWKSLDIQFVPYSVDNAVNRLPLGGSNIRQAFREVDAPFLDSLCVGNSKPPDSYFQSYGEFAHWNTPRLRRVTAVHFFPVSLPGLANVTTLEITLVLYQINFADVLKDLSKMDALEDFTLKLARGGRHRSQPAPDAIQLYEKTELPTIRRLKIESDVHDSCPAPIVSSLFSSLFFPGAIDLHIRLSGIMVRLNRYEDDTSLRLDQEMVRIFRHADQFPRVERFHLEVNVSADDPRGAIDITVPLNILPSVKQFTLQSKANIFLSISIRHLDDANRILLEDETVVPPRVLGHTLPALETIIIQMPQLMAFDVAVWVKDILFRQKQRGEWDAFRELLVVEDVVANGQQEKKVMETYVGDAALAWWESVLSLKRQHDRRQALNG